MLPQLRLAIAGGALLIALHLLAEYGLFVLIRFDTLTTAIVDQFQAVYDGPAANLLGIVLVACAAGVLGLEAWLRGNRRYARVGPGAARGHAADPARPRLAALDAGPRSRWRRSRWRCRWRRWCAGSGAAARRPGTCRRSARRSGRRRSTRSSAALLACLAALPVAWMSARAPGRLQRGLEACHLYVGSLPGVIVALALVAVTVRVALPLYQTVAMLLAAYVLLFLARAIIALRASLAQVPIELEQAAVALGRPPLLAAVGTTCGWRRRASPPAWRSSPWGSPPSSPRR